MSGPAWAGPRPLARRDFVLCVDPGHGGDNTGCVAPLDGGQEKAFTLATALAVRVAVLERLPHVQVVLTRDRDVPRTLADRVATANRVRADAMISVHANASVSGNQHGFETYVLDAEASSLDAARTARRENDEGLVEPASSEKAPDVGTMLRQLEMASQRRGAGRLAHAIQRHQQRWFPDRTDRGVRQARFDVLLGARMPAVLFESGFLDHGSEGPLLMSETGMAKVVEGLADAVVDFYRDHMQNIS